MTRREALDARYLSPNAGRRSQNALRQFRLEGQRHVCLVDGSTAANSVEATLDDHFLVSDSLVAAHTRRFPRRATNTLESKLINQPTDMKISHFIEQFIN